MQLNTSPRRLPIGKRRLYWNRPWAKAIASIPREGRVMRAVRRALIAASGRPLTTRDLLRWAYPKLERFQCWHYWSIYRTAPRYAVKDGRYWVPRTVYRQLM
jgi:hypothetical protein